MQKAVFVARNTLQSLGCLCVLTVVSVTVSAQEPTAPPMPKDPNQLLLLAQKQNRLTNPDIRHWHLKISVMQFDALGGVTAKSQVEEFWAGESKHKVIYTTPTASMTEYATEKGLFRSAGNPIPPGPLMATANAFTNPIFENENLIEKWILNRENRKVNGVKLVCVSTKGIKVGSEKREFTGSTYCLDPAKPSLLSRLNPVSSTGEAVYTRNNIQDFGGYYVPQELELTVGGKRTVEAHLELIEDLAQADDALFLPPSDAVPAPVVKTVNLSAGASHAILQHANAPDYPIAAKAAGIRGTVVIEAKISKDGSVSDLKIVSGPKELLQSAMDAVRTWKYKPYLVNGEPMEVRTTVNVVFQPDR
jgi:TonB family protein